MLVFFYKITELNWIEWNGNDDDKLSRECLDSLAFYQKRIVKQMNDAVLKPPKREMSQKFIPYPHGKVKVETQPFRKISIENTLLKLLFGEDWSKNKYSPDHQLCSEQNQARLESYS